MTIEVLHPPRLGPEGPENVRSLVLRVTSGERSLLLTGDLEKAGLEMFLRTEPRRCEVVMFPHHGSKRLDPMPLVRWARAEWLIACQGATTLRGDASPDSIAGVRLRSTHTHGAITCRATPTGWVVETFRTPVTRAGAGPVR
jgi:competence protein ComEC